MIIRNLPQCDRFGMKSQSHYFFPIVIIFQLIYFNLKPIEFEGIFVEGQPNKLYFGFLYSDMIYVSDQKEYILSKRLKETMQSLLKK